MSNRNYVYFIRDDNSGLVKIGRSYNPEKRRKQLQSELHGHDLVILGTMECPAYVEAELHYKFKDYRENGEWFRPEFQLMEYISLHAERPDIAYSRFKKIFGKAISEIYISQTLERYTMATIWWILAASCFCGIPVLLGLISWKYIPAVDLFIIGCGAVAYIIKEY